MATIDARLAVEEPKDQAATQMNRVIGVVVAFVEKPDRYSRQGPMSR